MASSQAVGGSLAAREATVPCLSLSRREAVDRIAAHSIGKLPHRVQQRTCFARLGESTTPLFQPSAPGRFLEGFPLERRCPDLQQDDERNQWSLPTLSGNLHQNSLRLDHSVRRLLAKPERARRNRSRVPSLGRRFECAYAGKTLCRVRLPVLSVDAQGDL